MFLEAIERESATFADTARLGLEPRVPSCPEWNARDLVIHLGDVYTLWERIVGRRARDRETDVGPIRAQLREERAKEHVELRQAVESEVVQWFEGRARRLQETLTRADPEGQIWTWWREDEHPLGVQRRMAHETGVHRWDMQLAHGRTQPIDAELARDGIDEIMDKFLPIGASESGEKRRGESYHFHRTDGEGEWLVTLDPDGPVVQREHGKADVAVRGSASDLLLFLWHRIPAERLEVFGDQAMLERLFEVALHD